MDESEQREGNGMTDDLERTARETIDKINTWRNLVIGGYEPESEGAVEIITKALSEVREADAKVVGAKAAEMRQEVKRLKSTVATETKIAAFSWVASELEALAAAIRQGVK